MRRAAVGAEGRAVHVDEVGGGREVEAQVLPVTVGSGRPGREAQLNGRLVNV